MVFSASKVARPEIEASSGEAAEMGNAGGNIGSAAGLVGAPREAPPPPARSPWAVPWLAGLTLAVLYLLYRSFA